MVEQTTIVTDAVTPEAFLVDRQKFWKRWTRFVVGSASFIVLILIGMAVFLL
jgi:hypothetical protein